MRRIIFFLIGVLMIMGLGGCGKQKYQLHFDGYGFESEKTSYAQGEKVTVYYDLIATDTDYHFSCDEDVKMKQDYDGRHGYSFVFTMPDHDVTLHVESRNSMEYVPGAHLPESPEDPEPESEGDDSGTDETWFCPECGQKNTGKYCTDCGLKKP